MINPLILAGHKLLEYQIMYDAYQNCVGSVMYRRKLVTSLVPKGFNSFLDIGCGTASTVDLLPGNASYIGVDISQKYLQKAVSRRPDLTLIQGDISKQDWLDSANIAEPTMCIALGIYHHLDDYQLNNMLDNCISILPLGSQIFSMDPVIVSSTSRGSKWFAENDRGKFVRTPDKLDKILTSKGLKVELFTKKNEMRIPLDTVEIMATRE